LLVAAARSEIVFLDTGRMLRGGGDPVVGKLGDGLDAVSMYVNVTADDKLLFVSDEGAMTITVIDLARARTNGFRADAVIGEIPTGNAPIALTFSPDGKWLYTTSQRALDDWKWPIACKPEGQAAAEANAMFPEGAVMVVERGDRSGTCGHGTNSRRV
jgi:hypothetical protein